MRRELLSIGVLTLATMIVVVVVAVIPVTPPDAMSTITGSLHECDRGYCVDNRPIAFPVDDSDGSSTRDFDHDGRVRSLEEELKSSLGEQVVVEIGESEDVVAFNGVPVSAMGGGAPDADDQAGDQRTPTVQSGSIVGVLGQCGDGYCVGGIAVYFGPWWYLHHGIAPVDIDGDGVIGSPASELSGLLGSEIVVESSMGGEPMVVSVNGTAWTEPGVPPPWAGGPRFEPPEEDDGPPSFAESDGGGPPAGVGAPSG